MQSTTKSNVSYLRQRNKKWRFMTIFCRIYETSSQDWLKRNLHENGCNLEAIFWHCPIFLYVSVVNSDASHEFLTGTGEEWDGMAMNGGGGESCVGQICGWWCRGDPYLPSDRFLLSWWWEVRWSARQMPPRHLLSTWRSCPWRPNVLRAIGHH